MSPKKGTIGPFLGLFNFCRAIEFLCLKVCKEAADRAFAHYFPPASDKPSRRRKKSQLFTVCPDIDAEALLANASEDMLSISAIAADLADDVEGSRRSVALAISRMADGVQLLVERALDHYEALQMQLRAQAKV